MNSSKNSPGFGKMLLFGATAAVVGGVIAYRRHRQIEEIVDSFSVTLDGEDFDSLDEESIVHTVFDQPRTEGEPEEDFVVEQMTESRPEEDMVTESAKESAPESAG